MTFYKDFGSDVKSEMTLNAEVTQIISHENLKSHSILNHQLKSPALTPDIFTGILRYRYIDTKGDNLSEQKSRVRTSRIYINWGPLGNVFRTGSRPETISYPKARGTSLMNRKSFVEEHKMERKRETTTMDDVS